MTDIFNQIQALLRANDIQFLHRIHEATYTSEESAKTRGEDLSSGAKAILYKVQDEFCLFVIAADRKIDPKKIKSHFKSLGKRVKKTRFATVEELDQKTGLTPGAVPPFGHPILPFELFVDPSLLSNTKISFNAGSLYNSLTMDLTDYIKISGAKVFDFCKDSIESISQDS